MNLPARAFVFCLLLGAPAAAASKPVVIVERFTSEGAALATGSNLSARPNQLCVIGVV